jgi:hypothetical protein
LAENFWQVESAGSGESQPLIASHGKQLVTLNSFFFPFFTWTKKGAA